MFNDQVVMLTWDTHAGFVFEKAGLTQVHEFGYNTEGWGITHDGNSLIMSDGTSTLTYLNPSTFEITRKLKVVNTLGEVSQLNELEWINGEIWANVYREDYIISIDPNTGIVTRRIDLRNLLTPAERGSTDVLNGIAYDAAHDRLFVTGKLWPKLFEITLEPLNPS